jgi:hypothetical protein
VDAHSERSEGGAELCLAAEDPLRAHAERCADGDERCGVRHDAAVDQHVAGGDDSRWIGDLGPCARKLLLQRAQPTPGLPTQGDLLDSDACRDRRGEEALERPTT